jgi:biopolymer transport protein ExbB
MHAVELFKNLMLRHGADWVLWFLVALLAVVVVISLERWLYYRRRSGETQALARTLESYLRDKKRGGAPAWPHGGRALAARVVDAGLAMIGDGAEAATQAMQSRFALEHDLLERRLSILGTIGSNAPFVGLLGTVIGVVHAFDELGRAAAAGQQQSATVMSGIAEALVATAVGLVVAIPAIAVYNYFHRRMASLVASAEVLSRLLLAHIALRKAGPSTDPEGERAQRAEPNETRASDEAASTRMA